MAQREEWHKRIEHFLSSLIRQLNEKVLKHSPIRYNRHRKSRDIATTSSTFLGHALLIASEPRGNII